MTHMAEKEKTNPISTLPTNSILIPSKKWISLSHADRCVGAEAVRRVPTCGTRRGKSTFIGKS